MMSRVAHEEGAAALVRPWEGKISATVILDAKIVNIKQIIIEKNGKILNEIPDDTMRSMGDKLSAILDKLGIDKNQVPSMDSRAPLKPFMKEDPSGPVPQVTVDLDGYQGRQSDVFVTINK